MTVYAVIGNGETKALYRSPADACNHAKFLADKKEEELRKYIEDGVNISVRRKENRIIVEDHEDHDYDEVWNYWVKSVDVLNKFEG